MYSALKLKFKSKTKGIVKQADPMREKQVIPVRTVTRNFLGRGGGLNFEFQTTFRVYGERSAITRSWVQA